MKRTEQSAKGGPGGEKRRKVRRGDIVKRDEHERIREKRRFVREGKD